MSWAIVACVLLFGSLFFDQVAWSEESGCASTPVVDGVADLRCWDGVKPIALSGDWHLSYQADREPLTYEGLVPVPRMWKELDEPLPFTGRGVYQIDLKLNQPTEYLGLKLLRSNMARSITLINSNGVEKVVFDTGNTDLEDRSLAPIRMPILPLPRVEEDVTLVIVVRNSESVHGGLENLVTLAPLEELVRQDQLINIYASLLASIFVVFFIVNLGLWVAGERKPATLILCVVACLAMMRLLSVSGVLYEIFPTLSNTFDAAYGWGAFFGIVAFGHLYFWIEYPDLVPKWNRNVAWVATAIGVLIYLTQPLYQMQFYAEYYRPIIVIGMLVLLIKLWSGVGSSGTKLKFTLIGSSIAIVSLVVETIYYEIIEYSDGVYLATFGLLAFMCSETITMARRYTRSILSTHKLAEELQDLNSNLELKIDERTFELAMVNEQLESMARTDPLTGLANRRVFDEALEREEARGNRDGQTMVVGIVDLDNLKQINDKLGHIVGDQVLNGLASLMVSSIRTVDVACRWGGDEFSILFPATSAEAAYKVAERLRETMEKAVFETGRDSVNATVSIGLAQWQPGQSVDEVVNSADEALYQSKTAGRNRVTCAWRMAG